MSDRNVFWSGNKDRGDNSLSGMLQKYTDKTVTSLNANTVVSYPVHVKFLKFKNECCRYLIDSGHMLVGLLPVFTFVNTSVEENAYQSVSVGELPNPFEVFLCNALPVSAHKDVRSSKLRILNESMQKLLDQLGLASG